MHILRLKNFRRKMRRNRLTGYKQLVIDNYIAIFKIDKNSKKVFVVTVQYQGQNI